MPFESYADFYDLLYTDKDYAAETEYVHRLIQDHRPGASSVLDFGCGTGRHAVEMTRKGYRVTGVDRASRCIALAKQRAEKEGLDIAFHEGDIDTARLAAPHDVVSALFHVISYLTSNDKLLAAFRSAKCHLADDGIFVFDCWYGPAVLSQRPETRVKRAADDSVRLLRIAEPHLLVEQNRVDVNYELFVEREQHPHKRRIRETHPMRYLFTPEIAMMLETVGMRIVRSEEWLTGRPPSIDSWGVCYVAAMAGADEPKRKN